MSFLRSFDSYAPPPRYEDGAKPFTKAVIQESPLQDVPDWTTIETIALDPDADPAHPASRDLSTDAAQLEEGAYRIVWEDEDGIQFQGGVAFYPPVPSWAPSVHQVAALIRARTKIPGGKEAGTFNENTRPTGTSAEFIIALAADQVSDAVGGDPCTAKLRRSAGSATAMLAAVMIETSYWPEQAEARGSAAERLEKLFNTRLKSLTTAVAEQCGGQGEGSTGGDNAGAVAAGSFNDGYPLIGRDYPRRW